MKTIFDHCITQECIGYYRSLMPCVMLQDDLARSGIELRPRSYLRPGERYNAYILHRDITPEMLVLADLLKEAGRTIVWELDDDYWAYPKCDKAQSTRLDFIRELADWIVVSTPTLGDVVGKPGKTMICPNLMDEALCMREMPEVPLNDEVRILWAASSPIPGDDDPAEAIDKLTRKHRGRVLVYRIRDPATDTLPKILRGNSWVIERPWVQFRNYHQATAEMLPDISICWRADHRFNRAKSAIKILEAAQLGACAVCSDIPPYAEFQDGKDCLKVKTSDQLFQALDRLVQSPHLRQYLWGNTLARLKAEFSWTSPARQKWLDMYRRITA